MESRPDFAYFGTPEVSRRTLRALIEAGLVPRVVITNPDALQGRGLLPAPSPVKEEALTRGIPCLTPRALDAETLAAIKSQCAGAYAVVVAYGKIFPEEFLRAFPLGVLNVHYSLLPRHRGATPVEAALLEGDAVTGVSIQRMELRLDRGAVLSRAETPVAPEETARDLRPRLEKLGADLLVETIPKFLSGEAALTPQDESRATYAKKLRKEDGLVSPDADPRDAWRKYRAYADTIGTHFFKNGMRVKIASAAWRDGRFVIERVVPEGRREMAYADFMRG